MLDVGVLFDDHEPVCPRAQGVTDAINVISC